jgi:hypothetical protein
LAYDPNLQGNGSIKPVPDKLASIQPTDDTPLLLVYLAGATGNEKLKAEIKKDGPLKNGIPENYCRFSIEKTGTQANFRLILIPYLSGTKLPVISEGKGSVTIQWENQKDVIDFQPAAGNRTRFMVKREGKTIVASK